MSTTPTTPSVPVLALRDLVFYHSGGYYNNDPKQSLGGAMSNFPVVSGTLNGLFDRVDTNEALEGDIEFRCIYLKNINQSRKLLKAKIWIETTTISPTTSVSVSIGSAGVNGVEPAIPHESVQPPMQFFAVPLSAPDVPNIGDLYPGDSIGLWVRWTVNPNTVTTENDFCVLRIDGEREPESTTTPLPDNPDTDPPPPDTNCPDGYHWDYTLLQCVPTTSPIICPVGYEFDTVTQRCKPIDVTQPPPPVNTCPTGMHWDVNSMRCVPEEQPIVCPIGYIYDETLQRCKPINTPPSSVPNTTFGIISDCVPGSATDSVMTTVASHINITDINQGSFVIHGGDATHSDGNVTPFFDKCRAHFGVLNPTHIFAVLGNHDDSEDGTAKDGQDVIHNFPAMSPTAYYAVTRKNIRIICMNTQIDYGEGSAQQTFVMNELQAAANDPAIKWKILVFHKPIVCTSGHHAVLTDLRSWLFPALDQYKVDLTISGHNHIYCRSLPLKYNAATPASPTIVSTQKNGNYINLDARIFLVTGTGGRDTNILFNNSTAESFVAFRRLPPPYGGINVTLQDNGNQLSFEARDTGNTVMDSWQLSKPSATGPPTGGIITCPTGYHWDETLGRCVVSPTTCPVGFHFDQVQNQCVPDIIVPPPDTSGAYPVSNVEWYYDSATIMATNATIPADSHASDGVLLSSGASGVSSCEILNGWLYIQTGGGNGRVYWDYHTRPRYAQDDQPGFNIAMTFKFRWVGNDNVSVKDGNHGTGGFEFENSLVFGGFGFAFHSNECESKAEYWHNNQGDAVHTAYPGNRSLQTNKEYRAFFTLRTDRVAEKTVLNIWLDFADGSGWTKVMSERTWQKSGWSPGSIPSGDDADDIAAGPSHIKRHHVWIRNNAGGPPLPVTEVKIGTVPYIS